MATPIPTAPSATSNQPHHGIPPPPDSPAVVEVGVIATLVEVVPVADRVTVVVVVVVGVTVTVVGRAVVVVFGLAAGVVVVVFGFAAGVVVVVFGAAAVVLVCVRGDGAVTAGVVVCACSPGVWVPVAVAAGLGAVAVCVRSIWVAAVEIACLAVWATVPAPPDPHELTAQATATPARRATTDLEIISPMSRCSLIAVLRVEGLGGRP
jgi:hypothetical protein